MKNKIIILLCASIVFSGCSLMSEEEKNINQNEEEKITIETQEIKYLLDGNKLIKDNGEKEVVNDNISSIVDYPKDEKEVFSFVLLGQSSENIFFIKNPQTGGIFYSSIYYLEIENLGRGFQKIENFLVQTDLEKFKYQNSLKIIGIASLENSKLYFVDLEKSIIPKKIYESPEENTFFHPSFYGDDKIDLEWKGKDVIEIKEYQINDIKNIDPNNFNTFPEEILKKIDLNDLILDMSNWQTYRNEEYGFEIKYPKDWIMGEIEKKEEKDVGMIASFETPNTEELINKRKLHPAERFNLLISYWDSINSDYADGGGRIKEKDHDSLEDFFNNNKSLKRKIGEINIGNQKAYEVIIGGSGSNYGVMLENDGIFELSFQKIWDKSELTQVEREIVSSFKFVK